MIKHEFVATLPASTNVAQVQTDHWNGDHVIDDPEALVAELGLAAIATTGSGADLTANSVTAAQQTQMPTNTVKANLTGSTADEANSTIAQLSAALGVGLGLYVYPSDGTNTMDGVTAVPGCTLTGVEYKSTRPVYFQALTVASGKDFLPDGYIVRCRGACAGPGRIHSNGGNAGVGGSAPGIAAYVTTRQLPIGTDGSGQGTSGGGTHDNCPRGFSTTAAPGGTTAGGGTAGTAGGIGHGGGGGGSAVASGGNGGFIGLAPVTSGDVHDVFSAIYGRMQVGGLFHGASPGGGGALGSGGRAGGSSGASGAWVVVIADEFTNGITIECKGGAGSAGSNGISGSPYGGGGGAGGAGGVVVTVRARGAEPTVDVSGGAGGAGGSGFTGEGGTPGLPGGAGGAGLVFHFLV